MKISWPSTLLLSNPLLLLLLPGLSLLSSATAASTAGGDTTTATNHRRRRQEQQQQRERELHHTYAPAECTGDESELSVTVNTHFFPWDNDWVLDELDEDTGEWVRVEENSLSLGHHLYEQSFCLDADSTYKWTLRDDQGDGMCAYLSCGSYHLELNGETLFESTYDSPPSPWGHAISVIFVTPSDPSGPFTIESSAPSESPSASPTKSSPPSATPSESSAPSYAPTVFDCPNGDKLTVDIFTDYWSRLDNNWIVERKDGWRWVTVASNDLEVPETRYVDRVCLEHGKLYKWTLFDTYGDGLNCLYSDPVVCGSYQVRLNGEEVVSNGEFEYEVSKEFGPVECVDELGYLTADYPYGGSDTAKGTCRGVLRQIRRSDNPDAGALGCAIDLVDGSGIVADKCKALCGGYGVGPCA